MVISFFNSTRLLADAGLATPALRILTARRPAATAARATVRLVDALLAMDDEPEAYRDVLGQLDAVQRQVDHLPEDAVETRHLERILDALPLSGEPFWELRDRLAEYEAFLQRQARLEEALDVLVLGARLQGPVMPVKEFAACALRAGRLNRLLARWDPATACYTAATDAGRLIEDDTLILQARLGRGTVYRAQGELTAARAAAELVMREAGRLGLADLQTLAYWELGIVLRLAGAVAEGLQAVYYAYQLSPHAGERLQALRDVGLGLAAVGAYDESRSALETVLESDSDVLLHVSALIGLMGVESAVGDRVAFERWREEAEAARGQMPPGMAVAHRYKLGLGLARFGQEHRARVVLGEALTIARANRLRGWCSKIEDWLAPVAMAG